MDNAQRFLTAFASIEKSCKQITGNSKYTKFYLMLQEATRKNKIASKYEIELQEYAELRNAIVHQRDGVGKVIAQPTDETVKSIEKIADLLGDNHPVSKFFLKKVMVCHPEDSIIDVQNIMEENRISKIPVSNDSAILGVLTSEIIAKWACGQLVNKTNSVSVKDVYESINDNEKIYFVSRNESVYHVIETYTTSIQKGLTVLAIIITEDGLKTQKPIGIITVKDLPAIIEYF